MIEREIVIDAPRERVFEVITDFESYPEFLNSADRVSVEEAGGAIEAQFEVSLIKPVRYRLRFETDAPKEVRWSLVKGDFMKKNSGSWALEALSENQTKAVYRIEIAFGWMVPQSLVQKLTESQLPELLQSFKNRSERMSS